MRKQAKTERRSIPGTIWRGLALRCPVCGRSSIVRSAFHIKHFCPVCLALFKREDGFFVGAIMANVVTTEFVILAVYLLSLLANISDYQRTLTLLFILALLFPIAFYHHSWSFWLSLDYLVEGLPKYDGQDAAPVKGGDGDGGDTKSSSGD